MEAALRGWEACQTTAVCLIELFVALKSKGRSLMQIQRKFWEKAIQERGQCALSHSALVMEDAGFKNSGYIAGKKGGPSCAIVWLTFGITWRCNSSSELNKSLHIISMPQSADVTWSGATVGGVSVTHSVVSSSHESRDCTQSEVCSPAHTVQAAAH